MKGFIKIIRSTPFYKLVKVYRSRKLKHGSTRLNILSTFPLFEARGWGLYGIRAKLTIQSINQVIPGLASFVCVSDKNEEFKSLVQSFLTEITPEKSALEKLFTHYGSDKASRHNYHMLYASILSSASGIDKVFEIGLGTDSIDIVSTMGRGGKPGASLRAFRDFLKDASVYGADLDKRVLFDEERINTYFVDQTDTETFSELGRSIGDGFDLMIDDGLHSSNANLHSLKFFLPRLKVGGFAVIEDQKPLQEPLWKVVSSLLGKEFLSAFVQMKTACVFVVKRIA